MANANFTVEGQSVPPATAVTYGQTVDLALVSTTGVRTVVWSIVGTSRAGLASPTITPAGSPSGVTASFTAGANPGDEIGISYIVKCLVNGGRDDAGQLDSTLVKTALIGVRNRNGIIPAAVGEYLEASASHGWTERVNLALAGVALDGDGEPMADSGAFRPESYGAVGDGIADDTVALQDAIDAAAAAGGGEVVGRIGSTYLVTDSGGNVAVSLLDVSNVTLRRLHIKLADDEDSHVINIDGTAANIKLVDCEIDGNRANQTLEVHGIRCVAVNGIWIDRTYIHDAFHYGIGLQGATKTYVYLNDLKILNTGGDGIDVKNTDDDNAFQVGSNIQIENFGLNDSGTATQAGFDCRGPWQLSNITVKWTIADGTGIRFRAGELLDANGLGGHSSHLTGFECRGPGDGSTSVGVDIAARDVGVSNGYITGIFRGLQVSDDRATVSQVTVFDPEDDSFLAAVGADDCTFRDCTSNTAGDAGFRFRAARGRVLGGTATAGVRGVATEATATDTVIDGVSFSSNTTNLDDVGIDSRIGGNNIGLGGLVDSSISESVASAANSANIDVALASSTYYLFRVHVLAEDSNADRATLRSLVEIMRSGGNNPASPTTLEEFASGGAVLTLNASASGNNLRISVTNGMGQDCRMTIRIWEVHRDDTVEYS